MNVSLTVELEQLVNDKVKTGMYQTASEVIREGLRLLKERDQRLESLRRDVRAGFEAVEHGEYSDYEPKNVHELAERAKARGRKRIAGEAPKTSKR
jgi:antitoxin ParD1/3/4